MTKPLHVNTMNKAQIIEGKYIVAGCKKYKLYKFKNGLVAICSKFRQLWNLLQFTNDYEYGGVPATDIAIFPLPEYSTSVLQSDGYVNNLVNWKLMSNNLGPVSTGGVSVDLQGESIYYKVSWKASQDISINFYSEASKTGYIPITTLEGNLAIFKARDGSFETWDYGNFYISTFPQAAIELVVEIVIPKPKPDLVPSTTFLYFESECKIFRFPVYKSVLIENDTTVHLIINPKLRKLQQLMMQTLEKLSLPFASVPNIGISATLVPIERSPGTIYYSSGMQLAGYTTVFQGEFATDILTFWALKLTYLGINIYPDEDDANPRTIAYTINVKNPQAQPGDKFVVRLLRKAPQFKIEPQRNVVTGVELFDTLTLTGPQSQFFFGSFTLQKGVVDAILNVRFENNDPKDVNAVTFSRIIANIS